MFDNIRTSTRYLHPGMQITEAVLDLDDDGLRVVVSFTIRPDHRDPRVDSVQVLSRIFAIPAPRMLGRTIPRSMMDCMRYDIVKAGQHLPFTLETV